MFYKKLPDLKTLSDEEVQELQINMLKTIRNNTFVIMNLVFVVLIVTVLGFVLLFKMFF